MPFPSKLCMRARVLTLALPLLLLPLLLPLQGGMVLCLEVGGSATLALGECEEHHVHEESGLESFRSAATPDCVDFFLASVRMEKRGASVCMPPVVQPAVDRMLFSNFPSQSRDPRPVDPRVFSYIPILRSIVLLI